MPDWQQGVPADLLAAVEDFVLMDDLVVGTQRADAIQFLLNLLLDAGSPAEIESFVRNHEGSDFTLVNDPNGILKPLADMEASSRETVTIPKALFSSLAREIMTFPDEDERAVREASLREAIGEATGWLVDQEKLLGHLLLAHGIKTEGTQRDHDSLLTVHAGFHRMAQPGDRGA
jgi:hypothetical protein